MEPKATFLRWRLFTSSLGAADLITTNLIGLKQVLERDFGVPPEKVEEFSWGINLDTFVRRPEIEQKKFRDEWAIPEQTPILLSPRYLGKWWGIETIVEAIPSVLKKAPAIPFS